MFRISLSKSWFSYHWGKRYDKYTQTDTLNAIYSNFDTSEFWQSLHSWFLIHDPLSMIHDPQSMIHNPQSKTNNTRIHNQWYIIHIPQFMIHNIWSSIHNPQSIMHNPSSIIYHPWSTIRPMQTNWGNLKQYQDLNEVIWKMSMDLKEARSTKKYFDFWRGVKYFKGIVVNIF